MTCSHSAPKSRRGQLFALIRGTTVPNKQQPKVRRFAINPILVSFAGLFGTALSITLLDVSSSPARGEVLYQTGFEQPTFAPGPIVGQAGWTIEASDTGGPVASIPVGSISTTFPKGGTQSLRIDPMANDAGAGAFAAFRYLPGGASPVFNGEGREISVKG